MFNKKILTSMVVAGSLGLGSIGVAFAQPAEDTPPPPPPPGDEMQPPPPPPMHHPRMFGPEVGPLGMIFHGIKLKPEQKKQIHTIIAKAREDEKANRGKMKDIDNQIALALLSAGKVTPETLKPILDQKTALEEATKARHLKTILELRDVLTPEQLAQAKTRYTKMKSIRDQMKALHKQIHELNAPTPAADTPNAEPDATIEQ